MFVYLLHFLYSCTNDKRKEDEDGRMPVDEGKNSRQGCDPEYCSQSEHLWISVKIKSKYLKVKEHANVMEYIFLKSKSSPNV